MKLIFLEYLASLKERGELDVIMPDLLSEIGFTVFSRPAVGTKQHGVDVAAVGPGPDADRTLFLISIKPGDLRRSGWDVGSQALRTSLNQIQDVYIENHIPKRYADLPVVIVLCLGGDLHEDVRADVEGYMARCTKGRISFDLWNGDRLADLLLSGVLRENALPDTLPDTWRSDFRKSVALVDEPDVSFSYYSRYVTSIVDNCKSSRPACLTAIRQIYLGLWTHYVWSRTENNIEAAYLCSERAVLISWPLIKNHLTGKSKHARQINDTMQRLMGLHNLISDEYLASYVEARSKTLHGLSSSVPTQSSLDINLRLFDILGRIATRGLWQFHLFNSFASQNRKEEAAAVQEAIEGTAQLLVDVILNNPILCTPTKDSHAIDINIACLFLNKSGNDQLIRNWIEQTASATIFAYTANLAYPCVFDDYRDLIDHPRDTADYRAEATVGSVLVPTLAVWSALTDDAETLAALADFVSGPYEHSTLQLWYPGPDTEEHLYHGSANHGLAATDIRIARTCEDMLGPIVSECARSSAFSSLSAIQYGLWPFLVSASRHHRVPVPPHFWPIAEPKNDRPPVCPSSE